MIQESFTEIIKMKRKINKDMLSLNKIIEENIRKRYKTSFWEKVWNVIEGLAVFILISFLIFGIVFLIMTLIENPLSLAILCATIFLIIIWWKR